MPRQGLGNSAIASVATEEQLERYGGRWAAMAITEPEAGSDSAAIRTTAELDGDEYVLNGEKIYVTSGERADLVVVWATLDRSQGARRDQVVRRRALQPGAEARRGSSTSSGSARPTPPTSASRTAGCRRRHCSGSAEIDVEQGFGGAMQTFDNTRPLGRRDGGRRRARGARGDPRRSSSAAGVEIDYVDPRSAQPAAAARLLELEADYEAARLLTLQAAWMADNGKPNSLQASMAKAKAGRTCVEVTLGCVELCGSRRLRRERAAREVGPRREDPRHLRGHPADPAADHRPPAARQELG